MSIEIEILKCPDCGGDLYLAQDMAHCQECQRHFGPVAGVYDFRPGHLEAVKYQEDAIFANPPDADQKRPWRNVIGHPWARRFDDEVVDTFRQGRFLELGGETCYAAAMYKSIFPEGIVYASDVSPNTLRNKAIPTSRCFPLPPDFFLALDAENIPFNDQTLDAVFAQAIIHHLPNPVKMFDEVQRVLKPGGRFVAIDAAVPRHFRFLFARIAHDREARWGIQEDLIPYTRWAKLIERSALPASCLRIYTNPRYQTRFLYKSMGALVHMMPESISKTLFPVGVMIVYQKHSP